MKVKTLIYCTKATKKNDYLTKVWNNQYELSSLKEVSENDTLNGKIVCECEVDTEEIEDKVSYFDSWFNEGHHTKTMSNKELEKRSCLSYQDLCKYLGEGEPTEVVGYALHLSNIKVFDKPRELKECYYYNSNFDYLLKAPQNMCYAFEPIQFDEINIDMRRLVLISVRPQWLCKILNGEKDIEVRRKVLKGMCD
jgi:predicted transcriptional regulator